MIIQGFQFVEQVTRRPGNLYDARSSYLSSFVVGPPMQFPARFSLQSLGLLRRESNSGSAPFSLRFNLVDEDGKPTGFPRQTLFEAEFEDGLHIYYLVLKVELEFPAPGKYRLDIVADDGVLEDVFRYPIDIAVRP